MSSPSILVIGASGTIGSALVKELLSDHQSGQVRLVAATRKEEAAKSLREHGIEVRRLDLDEAEMGGLDAIQPHFAGIDRVFLLTGYTVRMLAQSKVAVDAAKAAGVGHIVHLGASSGENSTIEYSTWHSLIEAYIEGSGIDFTHVRPCGFMNLLPLSVAAPGVFAHFVGDARTNWVDVRDVAAVAATVLRDPKPHHGRTYHLAAKSASINEIVNLLTEVTGQSFQYQPASPDLFYEQMVAGGYDPVYMRGVRNYLTRVADGSLQDPTGIYDTIESVTGRSATSLRHFLEANRDAFAR